MTTFTRAAAIAVIGWSGCALMVRSHWGVGIGLILMAALLTRIVLSRVKIIRAIAALIDCAGQRAALYCTSPKQRQSAENHRASDSHPATHPLEDEDSDAIEINAA